MKKTSHGLGKGLGALLGDLPVTPSPLEMDLSTPPEEALAASSVLQDVDIDYIQPNPHQARKAFDSESLAALAESIRLYGVVQPILLRKLADDQYMLIAGERRWRAARMAGLTKLPAIVSDLDDRAQTEISLIENLQRENLNPIEEARGLHFLMEEYGLTQQEVADRVVRSRPAIANALRLLQLPHEVQTLVANGNLSAGHARTLVSLDNPALQRKVAQRIVDEGLSVRQTESLLKSLSQTMAPHKRVEPELAVEIVELEQRLVRTFGTKVRVRGSLQRGRIEVEYYNAEDLQRIYELLGLEDA